MTIVYWIGLNFYGCLLSLAALFHAKARLMVRGRRASLSILRQLPDPAFGLRSLWFHFPSLGEFEQGRPVLEQARIARPNHRIVITFYSPSGYEIQKDTPLADLVLYLPADSARNARLFMEKIRPEMAVFTKYDFWYYFFEEMGRRDIPLYVISAIFRPSQPYFKAYGGFFRQILGNVTHFFVQNAESAVLLSQIGLRNCTVVGDTRFDRVAEIQKKSEILPLIQKFAGDQLVLVAGSTWLKDEQILSDTLVHFPSWKLIVAPHEVHEWRLAEVQGLFPENSVLYSELETNPEARVLIIDNIGLLSKLYAYGDLAYVGGGFGAGIHNTLEPAAHGKPVLFGPNYHKFAEAKALLQMGAAQSVENAAQLGAQWKKWCDTTARDGASALSGQFVEDNKGATDKITSVLFPPNLA